MPGPTDGRAARWDAHRAQRRLHVIDSAIAVIQKAPPGAELNVQHIADEAGMVRTVVYRHFDGKADLHRAVQGRIVELMRDTVLDRLTFEGTIQEVIERTIGGFVDWVAEHPNLYYAAERELGDGRESQLAGAVQDVADRIAAIILVGGQLLGHTFSDEDQAAIEAMVFGIIGQVRGTVGHWVRREERQPQPAALVKLLSRWIWVQVDAEARLIGLEIDPAVPMRELLRDET